jgi:uncharacterized protein (TIRG00374 family)
MKKKLFNLAILLFFIGLTIYVLVVNGDVKQIPNLVKQMDMKYFWVASGLIFLYLVAGGLQIKDLVKSTGYRINYVQAFFLGVVGMYYSLITPFATGGQPGQIYVMKKQYGIPVSVGTSVTLKKCIVYQVSVTALVILMFFYQLPFFKNTDTNLLILVIIGIICNFVGTIIFMMALYNGKLLIKVIRPILNYLTKFKIFHKINKDKIYDMINDYSDVMNALKKMKALMIRQTLITILQLIMFFSVTYFIYLSFGYREAPFMKIFALQTILYAVVSFIPTPGGAGASELGFYSIFASFFLEEVIIYAMIMWRMVNYYAIILFGGLLLLVNTLLSKRKDALNSKTRLHNLGIAEQQKE